MAIGCYVLWLSTSTLQESQFHFSVDVVRVSLLWTASLTLLECQCGSRSINRPRADNVRSYWRVHKLPKFKFLKAVLDWDNFGRGKRLSANLGKSWWIHFLKWKLCADVRIFCWPSLVRSFRPSNWLFIIDKYSSVWYDGSESFLKTLKKSRLGDTYDALFVIVPCCNCSIITWIFGHVTTENKAIQF